MPLRFLSPSRPPSHLLQTRAETPKVEMSPQHRKWSVMDPVGRTAVEADEDWATRGEEYQAARTSTGRSVRRPGCMRRLR